MSYDEVQLLVANMNQKAFKPATTAADNAKHFFHGSVKTDGVSLSVIKMTQEARSKQGVRKKLKEGQVAKPKQHSCKKRKWPGGVDNPTAVTRRHALPYIDEVPA